MISLIVESESYDRDEIIRDLNTKLKNCKSCDDFESIKKEMYDTGLGLWFYTLRSNEEVNSVYTRVETTRNFRRYYSPTGDPIKKDGIDCVAYDTVRNGSTKVVKIPNVYRSLVIR